MNYFNKNNSVTFLIGDITARGGIERVTINLANALIKKCSITIISLYKENIGPHFKVDDRINIIYINDTYEESMYNRKRNFIRGVFFDIHYIYNKRKKIKNHVFNNDIIISCDIKMTTLVYGIKENIKIIAIEHFSYNVPNNVLQLIRRFLYKKISYVISLTPEDKNKYTPWLKTKHIVIPNILQPPKEIELFENKENIVIAVGRLNKQKGFDLLLEAWKKIPISEWKLNIIGDGEEKNNLLNYIEKENLKNVTILPYKENIDVEYKKAKIFVLSSRYEGLGMVLLEALSHGLSCISFKCPAGPETILSKNNGILIDKENVTQLHSQLNELMKNPSKIKHFYDISPKSIEEYSEKAIMKKWLALIKKLI